MNKKIVKVKIKPSLPLPSLHLPSLHPTPTLTPAPTQCAQGWKKLFLGMSQGGQWLWFLKYLGYFWSSAKKISSIDISKKIWLHVKVGHSGILCNFNRNFGRVGRYSTKVPNNEWSADLPSLVSLGLNLWFYQLLYNREIYSISIIPLSVTLGLKIAERRDRFEYGNVRWNLSSRGLIWLFQP